MALAAVLQNLDFAASPAGQTFINPKMWRLPAAEDLRRCRENDDRLNRIMREMDARFTRLEDNAGI